MPQAKASPFEGIKVYGGMAVKSGYGLPALYQSPPLSCLS